MEYQQRLLLIFRNKKEVKHLLECPIKYFTNNLVFGKDNSCWGVYSLSGFDYDLLSYEAKMKILHTLTRFLVGIVSEAKFLIIPVSQNIENQFNNLKSRIKPDDPLRDGALHYANLTEDYLWESTKAAGEINDYRTYLIVKLVDENEIDFLANFKYWKDYFIKNPVNAINVWMNMDTADILQSRLDHFRKLSKKFFHEQSARMEMSPATATEVQWLIRRPAYRGTNKDVPVYYNEGKAEWMPQFDTADLEQEKLIRPEIRETLNLFSGTIHQGQRRIRIDHAGEESSYQTFLVITHLPDAISFPGCEYIYTLQQGNAKAEICVHFRNISFQDSIKKIMDKKREIKSQISHINEAEGDIPEELLDGRNYATWLESELKDGKLPVLNTSISICVFDTDPDILNQKADGIKQNFEDINFGIERPLTDQLQLYFHFFPAVGITVPDFSMKLPPATLASGIIGATHELGDTVGGYIGTTGIERKQVFLALYEANLKNLSANAVFLGNLGMGKSFNANLLLLIHIMYGGYGLIIDPKGERTHWKTDLELLQGRVTVVTLSADPIYQGTLDPFNIYRDDIEDACDLALSILSELFEIPTKGAEYNALLIAMSKIKTVKNPSMNKLAEILSDFPKDDSYCEKAKELARTINLQKHNGVIKLLFGDGTEDAITLNSRLNILQIEGLKLPSPDIPKSSYSREESASSVIMIVMSNFAKKFMFSPELKNYFKIILIDECYMVLNSEEGEKLGSTLTRMSRSRFASIVFNGHTVKDLPTEGIKNSITYKFFFRTDNTDEARRMLEFMALEVTPANIARIQNLRNGQCLFQDARKHVGVLTFDAVFNDIIRVFSTTPVDAAVRAAQAEEDIGEYVEEEAVIFEEEPYTPPETLLPDFSEDDGEIEPTYYSTWEIDLLKIEKPWAEMSKEMMTG